MTIILPIGTQLAICDDSDAEVDAARIPSIEDETRNIIIGFFYDESRSPQSR